MSRWADKLEVLSAEATKDPEGFLGHPVNAFKLIKRLNTEWVELENLVLLDMSNGTHTQCLLLYNVLNFLSNTECCSAHVFFCGIPVFISNFTIQRQLFPNDDDQTGAAKALMRLLDTYQLDTNTFSTGELPGQRSLQARMSDGVIPDSSQDQTFQM